MYQLSLNDEDVQVQLYGDNHSDLKSDRSFRCITKFVHNDVYYYNPQNLIIKILGGGAWDFQRNNSGVKPVLEGTKNNDTLNLLTNASNIYVNVYQNDEFQETASDIYDHIFQMDASMKSNELNQKEDGIYNNYAAAQNNDDTSQVYPMVRRGQFWKLTGQHEEEDLLLGDGYSHNSATMYNLNGADITLYTVATIKYNADNYSLLRDIFGDGRQQNDYPGEQHFSFW